MKRILLVFVTVASLSWLSGLTVAAQVSANAITTSKSDIMHVSDFVGSETCELCHADISKKFASNPHAELALEHGGKGVTCEGCHGGGRAHVESGGDPTKILQLSKMPARQMDATCLGCHASAHPNFLRSDHGKAGVSCTSCHSIHGLVPTAVPSAPPAPAVAAEKKSRLSARMLGVLKPDASISDPVQWNAASVAISGDNPSLLRAPQPQLCFSCHSDIKPAFSQPFHHKVNEGLMKCTDCHDTHGTFGNNQLRSTADQNMVCVKCHTETRGPFVFEHVAVKAEGCVGCHSPHGSQNARLLNVPNINQMCNQCHSPVSGGTIHGMSAGSAEVQSCISCHTMIHGSNINPALIR